MATPPDFTAGAILTAAQLNQIGMWKITPTVSGTGVSVASNGDVTLTAAPEPFITAFNADFLNYRILFQLTAFTGGASGVFMRMASGTTPNTTALNYRNVGYENAYTGGAAGVVSNNGTVASWNVGRVDNTGQFSAFTCDVLAPFATAYTNFNSTFRDFAISGLQNGYLQVTTSYNGFNLRTNGTNTMTGTVQVFGYN
jgi:hypothetical protein